MRRLVVAGAGMAAVRLAAEVRRHDPAGERVAVTLVGDEPHPPYNRVLLSTVVGGGLALPATRLPVPAGVTVRLGLSVTGIDRQAREVVLSDGSRQPYDALVLATGAEPHVPDLDDAPDTPGSTAFRTWDDCARIVAAAGPGTPVAVLGGGLLGLETARGLAARGCLVTVVHPVGHVLDSHVDPMASRLLRRALADQGVEFRLGVPAVRHLPGDGLKLADGGHVAAEFVVVTAGVRPRTGLARAAGLAVDGGVLVDDVLRTSDPRIHAIGDCARHHSGAAGLVRAAYDQAAVLAARLTGADPAARYRGTPTVGRLKTAGADLTFLGDVHPDPAADHPAGVEVVCVQDAARGRYAKLVLRDGKMSGAILLGLPDAAATVIQLFDTGAVVPADRLAVALGRALPPPAGISDGAPVCRCNSVSKADLVAAWRAGAHDVPALATATRATTGCGGCREQVAALATSLDDQEGP